MGRVITRLTVSGLMALLALLALATLRAAVPGADTAPVPPRQVGDFRITARYRAETDSGAFLRTGNPFATFQVREYAVAWRGRRLELPGLGDRFWQVQQLPEAVRPALLLAEGPNLVLVSDHNGRLEIRPLLRESDAGTRQWLDGNDGQPAPEEQGSGLDRAEDPAVGVLSGGRWLYLAHRLVLDARTLATHPVEPWWREGESEQGVEMNASNSPAVAFSPGRSRFVLVGDGVDYRRGAESFTALLVMDIASGQAEGRRLDPLRTPFKEREAIDAAWIARHFRWGRAADGREVLQPRSPGEAR